MLLLDEDLQQPISESRLTKYIIVFTPGWLKVPILEMRSILERWLLYELQNYCPGIDCFISGEIKNVINFIRISSRIAGEEDVHWWERTTNNKQKISKILLNYYYIDFWLRARLNVNVVLTLTDPSFMRNMSSELIHHTIHILSQQTLRYC